MSRTVNTMPYDIQKRLYPKWRTNCGYPSAVGGAWPGRSKYTTRRNRQYRRLMKIYLKLDKEIPPIVRCVDWDIW